MKNRVGLGTFPFANPYTPVNSKTIEEVIKTFINNGGYYIDTAPLYGNGEVEKILGQVLKSIPREKYYLCTKTIKHVDENGKLFKSGKYEDVIQQIDNSLKRLNVDYVDLLMIHEPDKNVPIEETLEAMEKLQQIGKVKDLAVSNINLEELQAYNKTGKIKYIQNRFSLINRSINKEFEKYLSDNKIQLIPYQIIEIGQLTGKVFENIKFRSEDLRNNLPYWKLEKYELIANWIRTKLSPIVKELGITIGKLSISWALHQKNVGFVIIGQTDTAHLMVALKSNEIVLPKTVLEKIDEAYFALEKEIQNKYHLTIREFRGLNEKYY